jgi:rRNA maturation endonuclease Nob1
MEVILVSIVLLGLAFAGIAIKIWAKKDGEFAGTCASKNPYLNKEGAVCGLCGAQPTQQCKNTEEATA